MNEVIVKLVNIVVLILSITVIIDGSYTYGKSDYNPNKMISEFGSAFKEDSGYSESFSKDTVDKGYTGDMSIPLEDLIPNYDRNWQEYDLDIVKQNENNTPTLNYPKGPGTKITDTTSHPASAVVYVRSEQTPDNKSSSCTGFIVGHKTVVTAGHCIYHHKDEDDENDKSGWNKHIYVYPGKNGAGDDISNNPYGRCKATNKITTTGWVDEKLVDYDYGILILDCDIGKKTGRFGYAIKDSDDIEGKKIGLNTYTAKNNRYQYSYTTEIYGVTDSELSYDIENGGGHGGSSGSAIYLFHEEDCGRACAIGIHAYASRSIDAASGPKINRELFDNIRRWKKENGDEG